MTNIHYLTRNVELFCVNDAKGWQSRGGEMSRAWMCNSWNCFDQRRTKESLLCRGEGQKHHFVFLEANRKKIIYIYIEMSCVLPPLITTFLDFIFVMTDAVLQLLLSKEGCSWERLQWGVGKHWFSSELFMWVYVHCFPILYFLSYLGFFFPLQLIVVNSDGLVIIGVFLSLRKEAKLYIN